MTTNESNGSVNDERVREAYERVLRWQIANEIAADVDALVEAVRVGEREKRAALVKAARGIDATFQVLEGRSIDIAQPGTVMGAFLTALRSALDEDKDDA